MTILKPGGPAWQICLSEMIREWEESLVPRDSSERFWTHVRSEEYERLFNPPSVYDWIDPEVGRK